MSTSSQYYKNILIDLHSAVIGDNDHNGKIMQGTQWRERPLENI